MSARYPAGITEPLDTGALINSASGYVWCCGVLCWGGAQP